IAACSGGHAGAGLACIAGLAWMAGLADVTGAGTVGTVAEFVQCPIAAWSGGHAVAGAAARGCVRTPVDWRWAFGVAVVAAGRLTDRGLALAAGLGAGIVMPGMWR
ncbi:MAG TPA: hypothetical protein VFO80_12110, partial [Sphingomonas sp.]|nr:hypothetical protein [Sphingomonas sp.]